MGSTPTSAQPLDHATLRDRIERLCRTNPAALAPQPSGFAELDAQLPGGGWPVGALTECLLDTYGIGELSLWIPALHKIAHDKRRIAFIAPPFLPYAPALIQHSIPLDQVVVIESKNAKDSLWATEQTLRCAAFGAVLAWPDKAITDKQLRRLQLAAEAGRNLGVLYRSFAAAQSASPAALRLKLQADTRPNSLQVAIHKCRGGHSGATIHCALDRHGFEFSPTAARLHATD